MSEERLRAVEGNSVSAYLEYCLVLKNKFESPPRVTLELYTQAVPEKPSVGVTDIAATTAIQCYAPGVAAMKPRADEKSLGIVASTLDGGHNTTRLHAHFTWKLTGVSRCVTHDVLHGTPFYNTEQQSQRYVEAKMGNFLIPAGLSENQRKLFVDAANYTNIAYFNLLAKLHSVVESRLRSMYPKGGHLAEERIKGKIDKVCQEVARYVLPIGQLTTMDYTLSELQLLRLFRASKMANFSDEARYIIGEMVTQVAEVDPSILTELRQPLESSEGSVEIREQYFSAQKGEFDSLLGDRLSHIGLLGNPREMLIRAGRNILGVPSTQISDAEILSLMMDPQKNPLLGDVYEVGMFDPLTSCLRQVSLTFATRLSHTADSQRQRQRRTPGATPPIARIYDGSADYLTPLVIKEDEGLSEQYRGVMGNIYRNVEEALAAGIPKEYSLLLLPNAQAIRLVEQGDLFDWLHRWKQRLCYTAQEEIFFISVEQVEQLLQVMPEAGEMLLAPCGLRQKANTKPRCPEGTRWCGQPVYNLGIDDYKKHRLV